MLAARCPRNPDRPWLSGNFGQTDPVRKRPETVFEWSVCSEHSEPLSGNRLEHRCAGCSRPATAIPEPDGRDPLHLNRGPTAGQTSSITLRLTRLQFEVTLRIR